MKLFTCSRGALKYIEDFWYGEVGEIVEKRFRCHGLTQKNVHLRSSLIVQTRNFQGGAAKIYSAIEEGLQNNFHRRTHTHMLGHVIQGDLGFQ
jgi:hypothetical protein